MFLKTYLNITQKLSFPKKVRHFYSGINFMKQPNFIIFQSVNYLTEINLQDVTFVTR